jgi:hypothetical protein
VKFQPKVKVIAKAKVEINQQKVVMLLKKRTQDLNNEYPSGIRKPRQEIF